MGVWPLMTWENMHFGTARIAGKENGYVPLGLSTRLAGADHAFGPPGHRPRALRGRPRRRPQGAIRGRPQGAVRRAWLPAAEATRRCAQGRRGGAHVVVLRMVAAFVKRGCLIPRAWKSHRKSQTQSAPLHTHHRSTLSVSISSLPTSLSSRLASVCCRVSASCSAAIS